MQSIRPLVILGTCSALLLTALLAAQYLASQQTRGVTERAMTGSVPDIIALHDIRYAVQLLISSTHETVHLAHVPFDDERVEAEEMWLTVARSMWERALQRYHANLDVGHDHGPFVEQLRSHMRELNTTSRQLAAVATRQDPDADSHHELVRLLGRFEEQQVAIIDLINRILNEEEQRIESGFQQTLADQDSLFLLIMLIGVVGFASIFAYALYSTTLVRRLVKAEQVLLETSEHRYRQLINTTRQGFWQIDTSGVTVDVNPALCEMLGRPREEILGKTIFDFVDEENAAVFREQLRRRKEGARAAYEVALQRADGTNIPCLNNASPAYDIDGTPIGSIGLWTDISDLKESARALEEAKNAAELASLAKSAFLANMSHEIRTPMNGIVGMAEIMARTDLQPEQGRMLHTIRNSSQSLLRIIDDVLDVSKIEAGRLTLEKQTLLLSEVIEGACDTLKTIAQEHNVRLRLILDPELPRYIQSDPVRLRQILVNLLGNAIKFSARDPGEAPGSAELRVEHLGGPAMRMVVADNGIGMAADVIDHLFQPFTQAEESTTRQFGGTGLGLAITSSLVAMMDGQIAVESEPGQGSVFTITLPIVEVPPPEGHQPPHPELSDLALLALVDEAMNRAALSANIEFAGGTVSYCESEAELEERAQRAGNGTVLLLALPSVEENQRVWERLAAAVPGRRFLIASVDWSAEQGCLLPDCYTVQRFPLLPSELVHGIAVLAGKASPGVKYTDAATALTEPVGDGEGCRILLVEDNKTNQDVISMQVKMLGHGVEIAEDGVQGLAMWQGGGYDLVLSDCHMPNMDGFQMTEQLRRLEQQQGLTRTPVVAITANALQGESERCLASGMDDYLAKPVELVRLRRMLEKWLQRGAAGQPPAPGAAGDGTRTADRPPAPTGGATAESVVDPTALTAIVGDDPDLHREVLGEFVAPAAEIVAQIHAAFAAQAVGEVGELGHKLKSSARTIGAHALADLCAALEAAGKAEDWDTVRDLHPQLDDRLAEVLAYIKGATRLAQGSSQPSTPLS